MYKLFAITLSILVLVGQVASASSDEDVTYLSQQTLANHTIEVMRVLQRLRIIQAYGDYLSELGARIADQDRFVAMLPGSVTDHDLNILLQKIKALYLEVFSVDQLVEIAAFHRTDLGQKLLIASDEQAQQSHDKSNRISGLLGISTLEQSYLVSFLTQEELETFNTFLESDAGTALKENAQGIAHKAGSTIGAMSAFYLVKPEVTNSPYLIEILEADGIVYFPNRVWRKDVIERLRSDLQ